MSLSAVVFDLDGTLVDTLPDLHAAVRALLGESGLDTPAAAEVRTMIGDGARRLVERALAWAKAPVDEAGLDTAYRRFLEIYGAAPCEASGLYAHVETTLGALAAQGLQLGVCTNKPQAPSEAILETLGVSRFFAAVVGGDAVPRRKPDPAHLLDVLDRLGAKPAAAVMVGDSHNDVAAARAAGVRCILVDYGYTAVPARDLGADRVIGGFAELEAALAGLPSST
ncbi:MAG: phosphoglycolate phosphatase [Geminicoccaceae bacterium]|jgi:phosphoglycolate phosphatase|nr:phosphoglycolate phosphatase [Geminicoccaceae bacterium]HRY26615.1 phosphoglycolate phosphatase [Geminicoccaceae bacterium]